MRTKSCSAPVAEQVVSVQGLDVPTSFTLRSVTALAEHSHDYLEIAVDITDSAAACPTVHAFLDAIFDPAQDAPDLEEVHITVRMPPEGPPTGVVPVGLQGDELPRAFAGVRSYRADAESLDGVVAMGGTVTIERYVEDLAFEGDDHVAGSYDLVFPHGERVQGRFDSPICSVCD